MPYINTNPPQVYTCSPSLWVIPVHQPQASSIVHWTWTGDSFHIWYYTCFNAILPNHPTLSLSHRIQKTVLYISVSFAVSYYILIFILLLLLLLSRFSRVRLCDPIDGSPPGSLSLGFSRQEHWSELPFTSPMHQSEKWKRSCSVVSDSDIFYFLITYFKIKVSYFLLPINQ